VTIDAVHSPRLQAPGSKKLHQLIGKQDVDIRGEDELPFRAADSHVLCDHLIQRKRIGKTVPPM
jgi:hypothetical protein